METVRSNLRNEISQLDEPGIGLSLVGLLLAVLLPPVGLGLSAWSYRAAKRAGGRGAVAWWGIWVGAILTALVVFVMVASLVGGLLGGYAA